MNSEFMKNEDKLKIWPMLCALILFISCFWIYVENDVFLFVVTLLYLSTIGVVGVACFSFKRFKSGASYIGPSILFLVLLLDPTFLDFRVQVKNVRHYVRFAIEKEQYKSEIRLLIKTGAKHKEWAWGDSGGTDEYKLIYDERDSDLFEEKPLRMDAACTRTILQLEPHFFVIDEHCPSLI